jgi:Conserved TM helix
MQNLSYQLGSAIDNSVGIATQSIVFYIPKILFALVVFVVGWWLTNVASKLLGDFLRLVKTDTLFDKVGLTDMFRDVGLRFSFSHLFETLLRWFLMLIVVLATFGILGLDSVVAFIRDGLFGFVPTLVTVGLILFVTFFAANWLATVASHTTLIAKNHSPLISRVVWCLVVLLGVLTALDQAGVGTFLVDIVNGFVQALSLGAALALGLAFGLGCKEEARCVIRSWMGKDCYDLDCGCYDLGTGITGDEGHSCGCGHCEDMEDEEEIKK